MEIKIGSPVCAMVGFFSR